MPPKGQKDNTYSPLGSQLENPPGSPEQPVSQHGANSDGERIDKLEHEMTELKTEMKAGLDEMRTLLKQLISKANVTLDTPATQTENDTRAATPLTHVQSDKTHNSDLTESESSEAESAKDSTLDYPTTDSKPTTPLDDTQPQNWEQDDTKSYHWEQQFYSNICLNKPKHANDNANDWAVWFRSASHYLDAFEPTSTEYTEAWTILKKTVPEEYTIVRQTTGTIAEQVEAMKTHLNEFNERKRERETRNNKFNYAVFTNKKRMEDVKAYITSLFDRYGNINNRMLYERLSPLFEEDVELENTQVSYKLQQILRRFPESNYETNANGVKSTLMNKISSYERRFRYFTSYNSSDVSRPPADPPPHSGNATNNTVNNKTSTIDASFQ